MDLRNLKNIYLHKIVFIILLLVFIGGGKRVYAQYYPVHATVQWPSPQSPYLSDYYNGSRDRLIVTLYNRDLQQSQLFAKLRIRIKSPGFLATSREELSYPMLELNANVPTRLSNIDLSSYLQPENLNTSGSLRNGQLPVGYTEFSVQVVDYYTGRVLSDWHTGRSYLDVKKPPILNYPDKDAQIGITEPLYIRFQWMPRHQGLSGTEYEFVLKELPDNGASPQSAFSYGSEIYRVRTRSTTLNYTHLEPILFPNRRYAWQVQAIARDGVDEIGMFENGGFSEISHFYLNDNCKAPTGLKSRPRFGKVDLSWNKVIGTSGYVLECRPKSTLNIYEWSSTRLSGESLTLAKLKAGWSYEWRVGTLCTSDRPVFSSVREFTLSKHNDELLADCGKEPVRSDLSQVPNLGIKAGDIITIGGDYPMTIIEAVSLGDGWYSGRGKTRLRTIIDAPVSLRFDRLRINVDKFQIDGTVEATFDDNKSKIADLDYIDDGGKDIKPATIRIREHKTDFSLPANPEFSYNPNTGELETTDAEGNPQTIKIEVPENASYESIFPIIVTDNKGNSYEISPAEQNTDTVNDEEKLNNDKNLSLNSKRIERIGDFNTESLSKKYGFIHFERGAGKYAFDAGNEKWYKNSLKLDRFYKPFAKDYIAGWKLIPSGEKDIVIARYDGDKNIDLNKVRFASEPNSSALAASFNETDKTWTISLGSVSSGTSYDVYALYKDEVIGKLQVLSYAKQNHKLTIVPINEVELDKDAIERSLNSIYNAVGVNFTVGIDDRMRGNYDWEVDSEKDGLLSTVGKSFWGYDKELKESTEMLNLQKTYEQVAGTLDGVYLFVLNAAKGLEGEKVGLLGEMPRKSRFGYIFAGNSPNIDAFSRTIAHELGHGIFTLQHTFDYEYAGEKTKATTKNLMDYAPNGKELAAFQWNIMANPALFTEFDNDKINELSKSIDVREFIRLIRTYYNQKNKIKILGNRSGSISPQTKFFDYIFKNYVYLYYNKNTTISIGVSSIKKSSKYLSAYSQNGYQINIADVITINCLSEEDRDVIWNFITSQQDSSILSSEPLILNNYHYSYRIMYNKLEEIKRKLIYNERYQQLEEKEKLILDLPLIMWSKDWKYGAIFMFNWITEGGDIDIDLKQFEFIDSWNDLNEQENKFKLFIQENKNKKITEKLNSNNFLLFELKDIRPILEVNKSEILKIDNSFKTDFNVLKNLTNFANCSYTSGYEDNPNSPYIAAYGSFTKKFLFTGIFYNKKQEILINEIWEYFEDSFDFEDNEKLISQPLGNWHKSIFHADIEVDKFPSLSLDSKYYLQNKTFNSFRNKTGIGKDFKIKGKRKHNDKFIESIKIYKDGVEYK